MSFSTATVVVLAAAIVLALAAALVRTWGAAYLGATVVKDPAMRAGALVAAGPYRYVRNPLYLGIGLHTLAIAILMPTSGAVFAIVAMVLFDLRLIGAEGVVSEGAAWGGVCGVLRAGAAAGACAAGSGGGVGRAGGVGDGAGGGDLSVGRVCCAGDDGVGI